MTWTLHVGSVPAGQSCAPVPPTSIGLCCCRRISVGVGQCTSLLLVRCMAGTEYLFHPFFSRARLFFAFFSCFLWVGQAANVFVNAPSPLDPTESNIWATSTDAFCRGWTSKGRGDTYGKLFVRKTQAHHNNLFFALFLGPLPCGGFLMIYHSSHHVVLNFDLNLLYYL